MVSLASDTHRVKINIKRTLFQHKGTHLATNPDSKIPTKSRQTTRPEKFLTAAVQMDAEPKPKSMRGIPYFPENFFEIKVPAGPKRSIAI